jgi:hypothetical protein
VLDDFHAVKSGEEIGTACHRTVIGKKKSVVVRNERFEHDTEIGSSGGSVADEGNLPEADHDFGKERLIESLSGRGESGGCGRMSMANCVDIRTHLVEEKMHAGLGRNFAITVKEPATEVHDNEVAGIHHALVEASGSGEDAIGVEADREIPFSGNDVAPFIEPATNEADIAAMLFFGARSKVRH